MQQVCRALTKAHAAGIVHRDLKPDNIFVTQDDDRILVKILDFGVAKATGQAIENSNTKTGAMLAPHYMSPEQAQGIKTIDSRSDLWSVAVIAYQCLTGRLPFESEALGDLLVKIIVHPIRCPRASLRCRPASTSGGWKAADRNPENRFQTAKELAASLELALNLTTGPSRTRRAPRRTRCCRRQLLDADAGAFRRSGGCASRLPRRCRRTVATPAPAMNRCSGFTGPVPGHVQRGRGGRPEEGHADRDHRRLCALAVIGIGGAGVALTKRASVAAAAAARRAPRSRRPARPRPVEKATEKTDDIPPPPPEPAVELLCAPSAKKTAARPFPRRSRTGLTGERREPLRRRRDSAPRRRLRSPDRARRSGDPGFPERSGREPEPGGRADSVVRATRSIPEAELRVSYMKSVLREGDLSSLAPWLDVYRARAEQAIRGARGAHRRRRCAAVIRSSARSCSASAKAAGAPTSRSKRLVRHPYLHASHARGAEVSEEDRIPTTVAWPAAHARRAQVLARKPSRESTSASAIHTPDVIRMLLS